MLIGIPKEIKNHEYRVSVSPSGVRELIYHGHQVIIQKNAGHAIGFDDTLYQSAGALIADTAEEIYEQAEMIVKVKEPQIEECSMTKEGQILFCYLHLAAEPKIADSLLDSGCIAIAYETVTDEFGHLPLLAPMSEIAGRVSVQAGAFYLERTNGGRGVLLGGVPGVPRGDVVILGGGTVGTNAAIIAKGMGANVTIIDRSLRRIRELDRMFDGQIQILYSTVESVEASVKKADLLIGAVLIPGAAAPRIVSKAMVQNMQRGAVIVDVAVDQGGCVETIKPTNHDNPIYTEHDVVHYGVTNMPSAAARTATRALENATLPYILRLADKGFRNTFKDDKHFRNGLNIYRGRVVHEAVANDLHHSYVPPSSFLSDN